MLGPRLPVGGKSECCNQGSTITRWGAQFCDAASIGLLFFTTAIVAPLHTIVYLADRDAQSPLMLMDIATVVRVCPILTPCCHVQCRSKRAMLLYVRVPGTADIHTLASELPQRWIQLPPLASSNQSGVTCPSHPLHTLAGTVPFKSGTAPYCCNMVLLYRIELQLLSPQGIRCSIVCSAYLVKVTMAYPRGRGGCSARGGGSPSVPIAQASPDSTPLQLLLRGRSCGRASPKRS